MRSINWGRVFLGGLLAGVVTNISEFILNDVVLKKEHEESMRAMNKSVEATGQQVATFIVLGFAVGIALVWLYAAIRPRFGPGARTAARAGVIAWFFMTLVQCVVMWNLGLFTQRLIMITLVWELVGLIVAAVVGAWAYKEDA